MDSFKKSDRTLLLFTITVILALLAFVTGTVRPLSAADVPETDYRWIDVNGDGQADWELITGDEDHDGLFDDCPSHHDTDRRGVPQAQQGKHDGLTLTPEFELVWDSSDLLNNVWQMAVHDFDGDGKMGIVSMVFTPQKQLYLFENTTDNDFTLTWTSPPPLTPGRLRHCYRWGF